MLRPLLRLFFKHFYHTFAWTYDFVAAIVSIGRWNDWTDSVIPLIQGNRVLEIGFGPGHLQELLLSKNQFVFGLDESMQMARITRQRLIKTGHLNFNLLRALAESMPLPPETFDTVFSTFPTEIIFDPRTLSGVYRILTKNGRLIIVPAATIIGRRFLDRLAAWLFKITDQAPTDPYTVISERIKKQIEAAGFHPIFYTEEIKSSSILIMIATK